MKITSKENKQIAIVYRVHTASAVSLAKTLSKWLKEKGYKVFTAPEQKMIQGTFKATSASLAKMRLVIALGGDGTYLRAVRLLEGKRIPILGVNLGSLGFLTPTRADEVITAVEYTLENKMELNPRSMIEVEYVSKGKRHGKHLSLNDIVLERGSLSQLITIEIYHGKNLISEVKADGIIVASPTGSTAYNLSAGGPILHPEVKAFVVTPIAPHSLTSRPFIMPDQGKIRLKLAGKGTTKLANKLLGKGQMAHLVVDGQKVANLAPGDEIIIQRAECDHLMVNDPDYNYFHLLRDKLKFGDRA